MSYGAEPNIDTFCTHYELQKQPKKFTLDGSKDGPKVVGQYGSCTFMVRRFQAEDSRLKLSWCQKEKWDSDWMSKWFYLKTTSQTKVYEDGRKRLHTLWLLPKR